MWHLATGIVVKSPVALKKPTGQAYWWQTGHFGSLGDGFGHSLTESIPIPTLAQQNWFWLRFWLKRNWLRNQNRFRWNQVKVWPESWSACSLPSIHGVWSNSKGSANPLLNVNVNVSLCLHTSPSKLLFLARPLNASLKKPENKRTVSMTGAWAVDNCAPVIDSGLVVQEVFASKDYCK